MKSAKGEIICRFCRFAEGETAKILENKNRNERIIVSRLENPYCRVLTYHTLFCSTTRTIIVHRSGFYTEVKKKKECSLCI